MTTRGGSFSGGTSVDAFIEPGGAFAGSRESLIQIFSEEVLARLIWPDDEGIELVGGFPTLRRGGGSLEEGDVFIRPSVDSLYFYNLSTTTWERQTSEAIVEFYQVQATEPTTRRGGQDPLREGDLWFNTTTDILSIYDGTNFISIESDDPTGTEIVTAINADGTVGVISADHTVPVIGLSLIHI